MEEEQKFSNSKYYLNRELGLLTFNERVLELAQDERLPLLERLRFLCISSSNLDEFFEVRVASLKQQKLMNIYSSSADGLSPDELLKQIAASSKALVKQQYALLNEVLIPQLEQAGIHFIRRNHWDKAQKKWLSDYFDQQLMPLLSPLGLDPAHPFPNIINKSLNFIVELNGKDAFGREISAAIVQAPRALARIIRLPEKIAPTTDSFVYLSSIMHAFIGRLFPGMKVHGCYQFRVTRNSNMYVAEEDIDDLLSAMKGELPHRHYGAAVRLEVADNCSTSSLLFLQKQFALDNDDVYQVDGPVNLNRLVAVTSLIKQPDLHFPAFIAGQNTPNERKDNNIFQTIRQEDVLLHYPYQSFNFMLRFVEQAAQDDDVYAIKITLYRAGKQSALIESLVNAARKGKEVTAVVELRARFDEEANIALANRLQQANVHVVYGIVGFKTHAKLCLVVRRENGSLKRYANLSTGNYHAVTAQAYTDLSLFTCQEAMTEDVHNVFHMLTGLGRIRELNYLLEAPFRLHQSMLENIEQETQHALAGKTALIRGRMNSLIEPEIIKALYRASQAGVTIELVVRGICCLRPGLADVSENISVRSVMGRYLEHPRVFYFHNDGNEKLYCASADWMPRNFFRRIEIAFPILNPRLRKRIVEEAFEAYLQDNTHSWTLMPDGKYQRNQPENDAFPLSAQNILMDSLGRHVSSVGLLNSDNASIVN